MDAGGASLAGRTCLVTGATSGIGQDDFVNRKARRPSKAAEDQAMAARLWDVSARLTGLPPG